MPRRYRFRHLRLEPGLTKEAVQRGWPYFAPAPVGPWPTWCSRLRLHRSSRERDESQVDRRWVIPLSCPKYGSHCLGRPRSTVTIPDVPFWDRGIGIRPPMPLSVPDDPRHGVPYVLGQHTPSDTRLTANTPRGDSLEPPSSASCQHDSVQPPARRFVWRAPVT